MENSSRHIAQTSSRLLLQGIGARYRRVFIVDSAQRCSARHRTMNAYTVHNMSRMNSRQNTTNIGPIHTRFPGCLKASCWLGMHVTGCIFRQIISTYTVTYRNCVYTSHRLEVEKISASLSLSVAPSLLPFAISFLSVLSFSLCSPSIYVSSYHGSPVPQIQLRSLGSVVSSPVGPGGASMVTIMN